MPLHPERARGAIDGHIAKPLGMTVEEAAAGMYSVINSNMADGIRQVSVRRGYDPRDFPLVVAGGAGPIHAAVIALELEIPMLLIPRASSIFCAAGMLMSDLKHDLVRTYTTPITRLEPDRFKTICSEMERQARATLTGERVPDARQHLHFTADLRYVGQFHEVNVPLEALDLSNPDVQELSTRFHGRHNQLYGYSVPTAAVELVTVRLTAIGETDKPDLPRMAPATDSSALALKGSRRAYLPSLHDFAEVPVYDGDALGYGHMVAGPALVEQTMTTVFVPFEYELQCDPLGSFLLFLKDRVGEFAPRYLSDSSARHTLTPTQAGN
jgi:N-methylhydantoinase A